MSDKIRRKDLKAPDEFVSTTQRAIEYTRENPARVALVVGGILVTLVSALGVRAYREWGADQARAAFAAAQQALADGSLEDAAVQFEAVHADYGNGSPGDLALVQAGNAWAELGKVDEALAAFRKLLASTGDPELRQIALYNLGMLEKEGGDLKSAEERLKEAAGTPGPLRGAAWLAATGVDGSVPLQGDIPDGVSASAREFLEASRGG